MPGKGTRLAAFAPLLLLAGGATACWPAPTVDAGPGDPEPDVAPDAGPPDAGLPVVDAGATDAGPPPTLDERAALYCEHFLVGAANAERHQQPPARCSALDAIPDSAREPGLAPDTSLECLPGTEGFETFYRALTGERVTIDHDRLTRCLSAGRAARQAHPTWADFSERDAELRALFESEDCAGAVSPLLEQGAPCVQEWDCPEGTACEAAVIDETGLYCLAPAPQGEPCATSPEGVPIRSCEEGTACFNGLCVYRRGEGQLCGPDEVPCEEELVCGPAGTCAAPADVGGPCAADGHCASGLFCRQGLCAEPLDDGEPCEPADRCRAPCSVCRPSSPEGPTQCLDRGAGGSPCTSDDHCRAGFWCADGFCAALGGVGTPCGPQAPCQEHLTCSGPIPELPDPAPVDGGAPDAASPDPEPEPLPGPADGGVDAGPDEPYCQVPPPVGSACAEGARPCAEGTACVLGQCRAGGPGEPCGQDGDCAEEHLCVEASCVLAPREGAPCTVDGRCASGLFCDGERCRTGPPAGQPCGPAGQCAEDAFCDEGTCAARRPPGAACLDDEMCDSGRCLLTQTCAARGASCLTSDEAFTVTVLFGALFPLGLFSRRRRRR